MNKGSYALLLGIGIAACVLFSGSAVLFFTGKTVSSLLQLFGAGCLVVVALNRSGLGQFVSSVRIRRPESEAVNHT